MTTLLVACGALAREVIALRDRHNWDAKVLAVPSLLHNTPLPLRSEEKRMVVNRITVLNARRVDFGAHP